jgi:hypothetical protein
VVSSNRIQANEDMVMMMQPFNNMTAELSAAPLCVSILGQVTLGQFFPQG